MIPSRIKEFSGAVTGTTGFANVVCNMSVVSVSFISRISFQDCLRIILLSYRMAATKTLGDIFLYIEEIMSVFIHCDLGDYFATPVCKTKTRFKTYIYFSC